MGALAGPMDDRGAIIDVKVMMPTEHVEALKKAGVDRAWPVVLKGLIDTGASCSAIDKDMAEDLKLPPHGFALVHTPSTGPNRVDRLQYSACMVFGEDQDDPLVTTFPVIESDFSTQGFRVLIGRDVLRSCTFTYDGPTDTFTLTWSRDRQYPATVGKV